MWNSAKQDCWKNSIMIGKWSLFLYKPLCRNFYKTSVVLKNTSTQKSYFSAHLLLLFFNYCSNYQRMQTHWAESESEVIWNLLVLQHLDEGL